MPDATIHTVGKVLQNLAPVLYRVELPNGKIIMAHLSKPLTLDHAVFAIGDRLILELTPYDFDNARILGLAG
jgi:translation initiation factor IF-1